MVASSSKYVYTKNGANFTLPIPVKEAQILGLRTIPVDGEVYPLLSVELPLSKIYGDPGNPRLVNDANASLFDFTKKGQEKVREALNTKGNDVEKLKIAIEYNGGSIEPIWVQWNGKHTVVKEGNRRWLCYIELEKETITCDVLPDDMDDVAVAQLIDKRHVSGIKAWPSAVRSRRAHEALLAGKSLEEIVTTYQFDNKTEAEGYIGTYRWLQHFLNEHNVTAKEAEALWSKFNHLYKPSMVRFFGYDFRSDTFGVREPAFSSKSKTRESIAPSDVDNVAASSLKGVTIGTNPGQIPFKFEKVDFLWFGNLVAHNLLRDCRHSDALVIPLIQGANKDYAGDVFKKLMTVPKKGESASDEALTALKKFKKATNDYDRLLDQVIRLNEELDSFSRKTKTAKLNQIENKDNYDKYLAAIANLNVKDKEFRKWVNDNLSDLADDVAKAS